MQKTGKGAQGAMEDGRGDNDAKMQKTASELGNNHSPLTRLPEPPDIPHSEGEVPASQQVPAVHTAAAPHRAALPTGGLWCRATWKTDYLGTWPR